MTGPHHRPVWQDAYDAQMALWRWYRTPHGAAWLAANERINKRGLSSGTQRMIELLYDAEPGKLLHCDPIFVSGDMIQVIEAAMEGFQPEPLQDTDLPTHRAFMWYERPIVLPDRNGVEMHIRAISWGRQYTATAGKRLRDRIMAADAFTEYGSRIVPSEHDAWVAEGLEEASGLAVTLYADRDHYLSSWRDNALDAVKRDLALAELKRRAAGVPVLPMHCTPWWYGHSFEGNEVDEAGAPTGAGGWWRLAQVTLRLMQQRLPTLRRHRPDRAMRREAERLSFPERDVVVVRLRREETDTEPGHESEPGNWSRRWIVDGHWRNQWYPSIGQHRQIWISPYVKGPDDKPLVIRPRRVFQWTR